LTEIDLDSGFTAGTLAVGVFTIGAFAGFTTVAADFLAAAEILEATAAGAVLLAVLALAAGFNDEAGLLAALATGFTVALALAGVALFVLAFTSCLLTETRGVWLRGVWFPVSGAVGSSPSARECTGIPKGKPIICSSVTNIADLRKIVF
jgi:hypothetical protein